MPQLNPAPWFMVFILIWTSVIIMLSKVLSTTPHMSTPHYNKQLHNYHWTWPWF